MEPEPSRSLPLTPKDSIEKSSASVRRALFARRRLDTSASLSAREQHSPSTHSVTLQKEPSPPRSLSPVPHRSPAPPSSFSPLSCHVSNSPQRPDSPVRSLSPTIVQSHGLDSTGPPGSLLDTSAQCQSCHRSSDRPSEARLVSHFSICFKNSSSAVTNKQAPSFCLYLINLLRFCHAYNNKILNVGFAQAIVFTHL